VQSLNSTLLSVELFQKQDVYMDVHMFLYVFFYALHTEHTNR